MAQIHEYLVINRHDSFVRNDGIDSSLFEWMQEKRSWLAIRDHPVERLVGHSLVYIFSEGQSETAEQIIQDYQWAWYTWSWRDVLAAHFMTFLEQNIIFVRLDISTNCANVLVSLLFVLLRQCTNALIPKHKLAIQKFIKPMLQLRHLGA